MTDTLLQVSGLTMRFGGLLAVNNVSLELNRGEIVSPHTYQILKSLETVTLKKKINMDRRETTLIGQAIVITCLFTFFYLFLALFRSRIFKDIRSLGFLMLMIVCVTLAA